MPQCNRCGKSTVWNKEHQKQTGKWIPFDSDTGEPHDCPNYEGPKGFEREFAQSHTVQQQEQQTQQPRQDQSRYETAYLIPKDDWNHMLEFVTKITAQLAHLSEFYDSVMQEIEALRQMAHEQQNYRKHQQHLARAEEQYDQDKEDGTLGLG